MKRKYLPVKSTSNVFVQSDEFGRYDTFVGFQTEGHRLFQLSHGHPGFLGFGIGEKYSFGFFLRGLENWFPDLLRR